VGTFASKLIFLLVYYSITEAIERTVMASCVTSVANIQFAIGQGVMPAFLLLHNGLEFYHADLGESIELQAFF
jgi:hypothetical protein